MNQHFTIFPPEMILKRVGLPLNSILGDEEQWGEFAGPV